MLNFLTLLFRYYETVRHLRFSQIYYRIIKPARGRSALFFSQRKNLNIPEGSAQLTLLPFLPSDFSFAGNTFVFLNCDKKFTEDDVDWNFSDYGLLWNYHLNYFDFLHQENLNAIEGLKLIYHFIDNAKVNSHSYDPYPVSLRTVNWIKFIVKNSINDSKINESLFRQYVKLSHEVEHHLMANHLLENGFSLLFGAFYFHDEKLFQQAETILLKELRLQILNDGAHIELSTMYHRIILNRVLDCINLMKNKRTENNALEELLEEKASAMLSWMNNMTFRNGDIPDFNDSAKNVVPSAAELNAYAKQLNVYSDSLSLAESGYRKFSFPKYEIILDAGNILPAFNPGHAHADMLSFCLSINDKPVIVDCGTSTYENNSRRKFERSTSAHNTVSVNGLEQSDMWASFRVGRRARILEGVAEENSFTSTTLGFTGTGIAHKRLWTFLADRIAITDYVLENHRHSCKAYLHFYPDLRIECNADKILSDNFIIAFKSHDQLVLADYDFAEGFNLLRKAKVAVISFSNLLETEIIL